MEGALALCERVSITRSPDFLCSLVAPARFLRLSLTKAAYAAAQRRRTLQNPLDSCEFSSRIWQQALLHQHGRPAVPGGLFVGVRPTK